MAIQISEENVFSIGDVPKHVKSPRTGKKLNKATAFRWAGRGLRGVRLETIRIGGTMCTSAEALQRFFDRLTAADTPASAQAPADIRKSSVNKKAHERAERELERMGI